jgi:hypothetical protein
VTFPKLLSLYDEVTHSRLCTFYFSIDEREKINVLILLLLVVVVVVVVVVAVAVEAASDNSSSSSSNSISSSSNSTGSSSGGGDSSGSRAVTVKIFILKRRYIYSQRPYSFIVNNRMMKQYIDIKYFSTIASICRYQMTSLARTALDADTPLKAASRTRPSNSGTKIRSYMCCWKR